MLEEPEPIGPGCGLKIENEKSFWEIAFVRRKEQLLNLRLQSRINLENTGYSQRANWVSRLCT
jgi:hypothetical protein